MKAKKLLLLIAFVLLSIVLVAGATGLAVAAPATAVRGDVTFVDWPTFGAYTEDLENGTWVWADNVLVWELSGDLVGTYTLYATYSGKIGLPADRTTGTATFEGTLMGEPIAWSATVNGSGKSDPEYYFAGRNFWKSTLVDGMKGQITIHQYFNEDLGFDHTVYWGEVK